MVFQMVEQQVEYVSLSVDQNVIQKLLTAFHKHRLGDLIEVAAENW